MAPLPARARRWLRTLARAASASRAVRIRFRDTERAIAERTLDPLSLAFEPPRWLVAVWSAEAGALRVLDLARILDVTATRREAGPPPGGFDPVHFALRRTLDPDAGPPSEVALEIGADLAPVAAALLPGALVERASGGVRVARVRASRLDVLAALADSLGVRAALDSPPAMPTARRREKATTEARLLGLASFILSRSEAVTRAQILEAFPDDYGGKPDAAERKLTRDKDALRRLGFHIETEPLGADEGQVGYFIDARACTLPAIDLAPDEAALVWAAGAGALRFSQHPLRDDLESALRKLVVGAKGFPPRAAAPEELGPEGEPRREKALDRLVEAWERRKRVRIGYWRVATGAVLERDVDVYGWASRRGEWIFVGFCHLREAVRIFYLSRVRSIEVNRRRPQDPDYEVPADFEVRRWSRQQIWDYDVHPPRPAAVRFRGSLARIADHLLPGARLSIDPAGARVGRLEVRNLRGLVRQALAWGPEAEIVEPEDGRAMAREILASLAGAAAEAGR